MNHILPLTLFQKPTPRTLDCSRNHLHQPAVLSNELTQGGDVAVGKDGVHESSARVELPSQRRGQ